MNESYEGAGNHEGMPLNSESVGEVQARNQKKILGMFTQHGIDMGFLDEYETDEDILLELQFKFEDLTAERDALRTKYEPRLKPDNKIFEAFTEDQRDSIREEFEEFLASDAMDEYDRLVYETWININKLLSADHFASVVTHGELYDNDWTGAAITPSELVAWLASSDRIEQSDKEAMFSVATELFSNSVFEDSFDFLTSLTEENNNLRDLGDQTAEAFDEVCERIKLFGIDLTKHGEEGLMFVSQLRNAVAYHLHFESTSSEQESLIARPNTEALLELSNCLGIPAQVIKDALDLE